MTRADYKFPLAVTILRSRSFLLILQLSLFNILAVLSHHGNSNFRKWMASEMYSDGVLKCNISIIRYCDFFICELLENINHNYIMKNIIAVE